MPNIRECLACEQSFDPADYELQQVEVKFKDQYCSKSCQDSYEQYLERSATIITKADNILTNNRQSNSGIDTLIAQFRKKERG